MQLGRLIVLALSAFISTLLISQEPASKVLIRDVRVFDGHRVLSNRSVLIENGKISRLTDSPLDVEGAEVIDGDGKTLLPGLIDAHVHVAADARSSLGQCLSFGVTTVLDMWNGGNRLRTLKQIHETDPADIADVLTAGIGATAPGGHRTQMGGGGFPTISDPADAQAFVDVRISEGSDYVKIIYDDLHELLGPGKAVPQLTEATLHSVIASAHKRRKLAVVHIGTEQQARVAINAGADGLAHLFLGDAVASDFGRLVAKRRVFVVPTLSTLYSVCRDRPADPSISKDQRLTRHIRPEWKAGMERVRPNPRSSCKATLKAMHQLIDAEASILAGTDAPALGNVYGGSLHGELQLLVEAGLSPTRALAAATSVPARVFGLRDRGRIQPGFRADLLLVNGDPARRIQDTRNIQAVWKRGIRVSPD